ncbi:MAG: hypothetical protein IPI49_11500 [Myxococcales bacterium]|nr:hypothetical protein [Myxococcales bacterium]
MALVLLLAACGGKSPAAGAPSTPPGSSVAPRTGTPASPEAPAAPKDRAITERECEQLADHLVELSLAEPRAPRAEPYTAEDAEAAKRELRASMKPACATLSRGALDCALRAPSSAALAACQ